MLDLLSDPAVMRFQQKLHYVGDTPLSNSQIRKMKRLMLERILKDYLIIQQSLQDRLPEFWRYYGGTEFTIKN